MATELDDVLHRLGELHEKQSEQFQKQSDKQSEQIATVMGGINQLVTLHKADMTTNGKDTGGDWKGITLMVAISVAMLTPLYVTMAVALDGVAGIQVAMAADDARERSDAGQFAELGANKIVTDVQFLALEHRLGLINRQLQEYQYKDEQFMVAIADIQAKQTVALDSVQKHDSFMVDISDLKSRQELLLDGLRTHTRTTSHSTAP